MQLFVQEEQQQHQRSHEAEFFGKNRIDEKTDFGNIYLVDFMYDPRQVKRHRTQTCNCKE